jgi:uncharacterized protein (DUF1697 family)
MISQAGKLHLTLEAMALVVFLKGINVGGHRRLRPSILAKELKRFDVVNVGATGIFVIRKRVTRAKLREAIARRVPFETQSMIFDGREILKLIASDPFHGRPSDSTIIQFVNILAKRRAPLKPLPLTIPATGEWGLTVLEHRDRFVFGMFRRQMKAIGYITQLEKLIGVPATMRNWNTILTIGRILTDKAKPNVPPR